jgi:Na+/melibiose symporter-like transporter
VIRADRPRAFGYVYGAAHLGKSLTWYFSELLFAYFLTEFCGLEARAMGWVLAASFLFSAAVDPLVGIGLGRIVRSVGRASDLQAPGALVSGLSLLLFSATGFAPAPWRFAYALATSCVFRLAYAFYDVPQNAILSLASAAPSARMRLSAIRVGCSGFAALVVALTAARLIGSDPRVGAGRFLWVSLVFAALGLASAFALCVTAGGDAPPPPSAPPMQSDGGEASPPGGGWRLTAILGVIAIVSAALGVFVRLEAYFSRAVLADATSRMIVLGLMALSSMASQPLWMWIARRRTFPTAFVAAALAVAAGVLVFVLAAGRSIAFLALGGFMFGAGNSGLSMLLWSAFAGLIAGEGRRRSMPSPGLAFAVLTSVIKIASAACVLVVSQILASLDYHSAKVAASWSLLAPMAAGPLIGATVCFLLAPYLWAPNLRRRAAQAGDALSPRGEREVRATLQTEVGAYVPIKFPSVGGV